MPRGDRTGPDGMGAMTGRKMGYCTGNEMPGFSNPAVNYGSRGRGNRAGGRRRGSGFARGGCGFGPGFGRQGRYRMPEKLAPDMDAHEELINVLREQTSFLSNEINKINQRISELEVKK